MTLGHGVVRDGFVFYRTGSSVKISRPGDLLSVLLYADPSRLHIRYNLAAWIRGLIAHPLYETTDAGAWSFSELHRSIRV